MSLFESLDRDIKVLAQLIHETYPEVPQEDVVAMWWNDVQKIPSLQVDAQPSTSAVVRKEGGKCKHLFTKGYQAHTTCGTNVKDGGDLCSKHRKACSSPAATPSVATEGACRHHYIKGSKAGSMCGIKVKDGGDRCSKHKQKGAKASLKAEEAEPSERAMASDEVDEAEPIDDFSDEIARAMAPDDFNETERVMAPNETERVMAPDVEEADDFDDDDIERAMADLGDEDVEEVKALCKHIYTKKGGTRVPGEVCGAKVKGGRDFCSKHKK